MRARLDVTHESWMETRRLLDADEIVRRIADETIDVLVIETDFVFEEVFEEAKTLKLVGICRNATTHVDVEAATEHGVLVVNTPGRNAQAVAEHALGLMLALARKIHTGHAYVVSRGWDSPVEPYISMRGVELAGRTLGIVGLGAVGRRLGRIGIALGMHVMAYDPYVDRPPEDVEMAGLDEVMRDSDFVSIHVPPVSETERMIDARLVALMRPGAGFDVFDTHPVAPDTPLLDLDNVVLTPHVGGATGETIERHSAMMADDVLLFADGHRPRNLVNPEAWARHG